MADETVCDAGAIIYKADARPVLVAEAWYLVLKALPPELSGAVYAQVDESGELVEGGWVKVRMQKGVQIYESFMARDFIEVCKHLGIKPRLKYRPIFADYTGAEDQDGTYTITHDEFVRFAEFYGVTIKAGSAPPPHDATATATATGQVKKWTDEFKAEVRAYRSQHGLKKTAEHFGVSQTTISRYVPAGKPKAKPPLGWLARRTP